MGYTFVIVGRTGTGKTSLVNAMCREGVLAISSSQKVRDLVSQGRNPPVGRKATMAAGIALLKRRGTYWFARQLSMICDPQKINLIDGPRPGSTVMHLRRTIPRVIIVHLSCDPITIQTRMRKRGYSRAEISALSASPLERDDRELKRKASVCVQMTRGRVSVTGQRDHVARLIALILPSSRNRYLRN